MANPGDGVGISLRVSAGTISHWLDRVSDHAFQNYPLLGLLKAKGLIKRITGGGELRWPLVTSYPELTNLVDGQPMAFSRFNPLKNAVLPWATHTAQQTISPRERAENSGEAAKVKLFNLITKNLQDGAIQRLGPRLFYDGNAAGNELEWHGLETIFGITPGDQTAASEVAVTLADTYAGLSTAYAGLVPGASAGQPGYDAWSPVVLATNHTPAGGSQLSWASNATTLARMAIRRLSYSSARMDQPDVGILTEQAHRQMLELLESTHRTMLGSSDLETRYGFKPVGGVNFEGVVFYWDRACTSVDANSDVVQGYLLNTDKMKLYILNSDIPGAVKGKGDASIFEFWRGLDPYTLQDLFRLVMFSQIAMESPRYFGKLAAIAA